MSDAVRVLVIDDDAAFRFAMVKALSRRGFAVSEATSGEAALRVLLGGRRRPTRRCSICAWAGIDGLERAQALRARADAHRGADRPRHGRGRGRRRCSSARSRSSRSRSTPRCWRRCSTQAAAEARKARGERARMDVPPLVGESRGDRSRCAQFIARVGQSHETVALYGETGTGKEVVARHLHLASQRARGAVRRAQRRVRAARAVRERAVRPPQGRVHRRDRQPPGPVRRGRRRQRCSSTRSPSCRPTCQGKLLRALESALIRPVGAAREVPVDVRIIAATNRDLWAEVKRGSFREDLYFRLQVLPLRAAAAARAARGHPAARRRTCSRASAARARIGERRPRRCCVSYHWPGNVRELLNVLRRAALFADGPEIDARADAAACSRRACSATRARGAAELPPPMRAPPSSLAEVERAHIERVLAQMDGNVTRAATALGIDRRTLQRKLKSFGLAHED